MENGTHSCCFAIPVVGPVAGTVVGTLAYGNYRKNKNLFKIFVTGEK
ncbi:MAG: hypothetical protein ACR5K3_05240 [Wolbachia sp.]